MIHYRITKRMHGTPQPPPHFQVDEAHNLRRKILAAISGARDPQAVGQREMNSEDSTIGSTADRIADLQRACDRHLRRGQVLHLSLLLIAPVVLILGVVARVIGVVDPLVAVVPAVPIFFLLMVLDSANDSNCQRVRDAQAALFVTAAREGSEVDFALYLRGDVTDDRLEDKSYSPQYGRHYQKSEKGMANALQPIAPLIAFGGEADTVGAGRAHVQESEWRGIISPLMDRARIVFFLPWFTPGVIWEAEEILRRSLLQRTIFIMPKKNPPLVIGDSWTKVQASMRQVGLHLPDYSYWGMLFTLDWNGQLRDTAYLPWVGWHSLMNALLGLARRQSVDPNQRIRGLLNNRLPLDRRVER